MRIPISSVYFIEKTDYFAAAGTCDLHYTRLEPIGERVTKLECAGETGVRCRIKHYLVVLEPLYTVIMRVMKRSRIVTKVLLLVEHDGKLLGNRGYDEVKGEHFYRLIGGTLEFGETTEEAIRREIKEELNTEIKDLELLKVVENLFTYEGEKGHQIIFVYGGNLEDKTIYEKDEIHVSEETREFDAVWFSSKDVIDGKSILYPKLDLKKLLY